MQSSRIWRLGHATAALALVGSLATAMPAFAKDDDQRFGEEILEILREEGRIDQERYEELKRKEAEEAAARDSGWTIRYKNGLRFEKNDGMAKFHIGGRIQADFATIHVDNELERAVPGGDGEGVEFRRARFYMSGELNKRIIWKSQIDFAGGDVTLDDVYLGMKGLGFLGTVKVGHMKEPYSLEELTSSKYISFMERSLPSVFDSARNFGVLLSNSILDDRMTWATGVFMPTDSGSEFFSGDTNVHWTSRITGLPLYANEGRQLIHLGVSGGYQFLDGTEFRFQQRPEVHLAQEYLDTGGLVTGEDRLSRDGNGILALEAAGVFGPTHLSFEWKQSFSNQAGGKNLSAYGAYVAFGWFLTGESRPYKKTSGIWTRVEPESPFDPDNGKWGAIEVAARYSTINLNNHNLDGGKEQNVTAAINWYLYSNVRLSANYVFADVSSTGFADGSNAGVSFTNASGDIHTFQARAQIEF